MRIFYTFIITIFLLLPVNIFAEKPLIGILGVQAENFRSIQIANLINRHLNNIFRQSAVFDEINQKLLIEQLNKFGCIDEICITGFAKSAGVSVIINGRLENYGKEYFITLNAYGIDIPYQKKIILRYKTKLNIKNNKNLTRLNYLCEEISAKFVELFFKKYKRPIFLKKSVNEVLVKEQIVNGSYDLYKIIYRDRLSKDTLIEKQGSVLIKDNKVQYRINSPIKDYFILKKYPEKSEFLNKYYYNRKKEIVLKSRSCGDAIYAIAATPIISGVMPVAAPVGYYINNDYSGLGLWMINSAPYLYSSLRGIYFYRPSRLRKDNKDISKRNKADYYFSYYYSLAGGLALFVDAASQYALNEATTYNIDSNGFMGNNYVAVYFSLVSGGAGHFYKGKRFWGYFYHHLDNILLYSALYAWSADEKYNEQDDSYSSDSRNKKRALQLLGVLSFVKVVEILHVLYTRDEIMLSSAYQPGTGFYPLIYFSTRSDYNVGLKYSCRF